MHTGRWVGLVGRHVGRYGEVVVGREVGRWAGGASGRVHVCRYVQACKCMHMYANVCTCMYIHIYTRVYMYTCNVLLTFSDSEVLSEMTALYEVLETRAEGLSICDHAAR